jgi:cytochrome oxidase Cu insertion factor (SCO1/SenC/PrrC family)
MTIERRAITGLFLSVLLAIGVGVTDSRVATALEIGKPAPEFTLPSTTGEKITLSQYRGKIVLVEFYGAAFAPV